MELETENNPAPVEGAQELSPTPEAPALEQSEEAPEDQASNEDDAEQPEEELEEWTDPETGKVHKVSKDLRTKLMLHADYTRKRQEDAEVRRQLDAEREAYEAEVQFREATWQEAAKLANIEERLSLFQNADWRRWHQANPQEAAAAQAEYMSLQNEHNRLRGDVEAKRQYIASQIEAQRGQALTKEVEALQKPNPAIGWDGKFDKTRSTELTNFITKHFGIPPQEQAKAATRAGWVQMAQAAKIGIESLQKQRQTPRVQEAQPAARVPTSRTQPTSDPRKMSMEQYVKARREGRIK
jgi:hypothetical protein